MTRTFGPVAVKTEDGTITAYCLRDEFFCFRHYHAFCGATDRKFTPEDQREHTAPDWCPYRDGIIEDARKAPS